MDIKFENKEDFLYTIDTPTRVVYRESEEIMLAVSKKKLDTNEKYLKKLQDIKIRVPDGYRDIIQDFAKQLGYSGVNSFVIALINEKMEKEGFKDRIPTGIKEISKSKASEE